MAVRTNTDGVDSLVLARYGALVNPRRGTPPPVEACSLRDVLARREAIKQDVQREHHRQEKTNMTQRSDLIQQSLTDSMAFHTGQLKKIQSHIDAPIDRHPALKNDLDVLHSIPAIGPQRGTQRLAVMHSHTYQSGTLRTLKLCMNACARVAKLKCLHWALPCAVGSNRRF